MAPVLAAPPPAPPQTPLNSSKIAQFVDPLPLLSVAGGPIETIIADTNPITLTMEEFKANVMPTSFVPAVGTYTGTTVWGYRKSAPAGVTQGTYIGPVIIATRNVPTQITFINKLGNTNTSNLLAYTNSTDLSLHWADPPMAMNKYVANPTPPPAWLGNPAHYVGSIPAVPHLHGGEQPAAIDGGPDQWFTSDGTMTGAAYYTLEVTTIPTLPNSNV